ncbi:hypothetical protein COOONC_17129 [Cooperia oncophora]
MCFNLCGSNSHDELLPRYVSAMVPVKSVREHDAQMDVAVLFSEVRERALAECLITKDQIDSFDPIVMICIPRLAIVWGLIYYPEGALNVDGPQENMSEMFRPYYGLLNKIRNLLLVLTPHELLKVPALLILLKVQIERSQEHYTVKGCDISKQTLFTPALTFVTDAFKK